MRCPSCIDYVPMEFLGDGFWECPACGVEIDELIPIDQAGLSLDLDEDDGEIEHHGMTFCGACGLLAMPGNEDYDWCDHKTGAGCSWHEESVFDENDELW